ncbi:MAG TPA: hypothetical protein VFR31_04600, partial [Thermoanaerobaculia bacterium]|nr:hypothetical protein [Thermoanaerobaculia bacterium]
GREIGKHRGKAEWTDLLPELAERIADLEDVLRENDRAFMDLHERELTRERLHVLDLTRDQRFFRGVALGTPALAEKVRSRGSGKWELSLLRFVTRAATKLSANSTLTTYALGSPEASTGFPDAAQREVSLVRLDRPAAEQLQALILRHPPARDRALVAWNDTFEEIEPGRYRFLRDRQWRLEPGAEEFLLAGPARITVDLSEELVGTIREALRDGVLRYDALLAFVEKRSDLDELIDLGLLILLPPWPSHEPWLEQKIGELLRTLPSARETSDALDELLALERSFASSLQPDRSVAALHAAVPRLFEAAARTAGHDKPLTARPHFFEDVLLESEFQVASSEVEEIMRTAGLIARFAGVFNLRHDVLHTLAAWWRVHEPGSREASFLEIAQRFAPVWKQFVPFYATAYDDALNTFDPLHAEQIERLRQKRRWVLGRSRALVTKDVLAERQLAELVAELPPRYAPQVGACVFVQPMDSEGGSSWVLNRLHEGTGRYLSRVVPILEGARRLRFLDHLAARSTVEVEGEEADLLEVKYPFGHLVRAHPPQAARVLDVRGQHLDLPRERRVDLKDLRIQADLDTDTFRLIDRSGRRVLPVNLSTLSDNGHSNLLRLLLAFGPGETRCVLPLTHVEGDDDFRCFNRLTCGKLVLSRRRWTIGIEKLRAELDGLGDSRAYAAVHGWRSRLGLPAIGFYLDEQTYRGKPKPQFVDFDSPSQCRLFVTSIRKMAAGQLSFEEALPSPSGFPFDASMNQRAFELLIDSLAIRTLDGNPAGRGRRHNRESLSLRME